MLFNDRYSRRLRRVTPFDEVPRHEIPDDQAPDDDRPLDEVPDGKLSPVAEAVPLLLQVLIFGRSLP